jgi:fermentation-respiration switch protein FrsA (DUF1100 family)
LPYSAIPLRDLHEVAVKSVLLLGVVLYVGFVGLLYLGQRGMMYFPDRSRVLPASIGFAQAAEDVLTTADGERVVIWHVPPRDGRAVVVYFQGNGGGLSLRVPRFQTIVSDGTGLIALGYRGYSGSTGRPTEEGLIADARAAYAFAAARYKPEQVVLWGESLGSGVAVALGAEKPVGRMVLEAPFTSAADVAAGVYPFVPVRLLMKDQFRSDERVGRVKAPILVMHGERDRVVPFQLAERLYDMIRGPKRFVRFPQGGHEGLDAHGAIAEVRKFISE